MKFIVSCLGSNELILFDEESQSIEKRLAINTGNQFDVLHSVRRLKNEYLISTTYGIHFVDSSLFEVTSSYSLGRLSNVHSVDQVSENLFVIANTGFDELIFVRRNTLDDSLVVEDIIDFACYLNKPKKLPLVDRRNQKRVSASDDWVHINCAYPLIRNARLYLYCCLFHLGEIIVFDVEQRKIVKNFPGVGHKIHSSFPRNNEIFVCSSQESLIKIINFDTGLVSWKYEAPFSSWTRSAKPIENSSDIIFTAERDRDQSKSSSGYIAKIDRYTHEIRWLFEMDEEAPFDIEIAF